MTDDISLPQEAVVPGETEAAIEAPERPFVFSYVSHTYGKGGQHTNGPDYGMLTCTHDVSGTAVTVDTYLTRGQHRGRELALMLCEMAVAELRIALTPRPAPPTPNSQTGEA